MRKTFIRFDNISVTFFGISGMLAFIFMYYEMIIGNYRILFKGWYVIFITIEIFIFVLGYRSFKKRKNIFQKQFQFINNEILEIILMFIKKKIKSNSLYYFLWYIVALGTGILLFFYLIPNVYMSKYISISYIIMFYVFHISYILLFGLLIVFELKNWK